MSNSHELGPAGCIGPLQLNGILSNIESRSCSLLCWPEEVPELVDASIDIGLRAVEAWDARLETEHWDQVKQLVSSGEITLADAEGDSPEPDFSTDNCKLQHALEVGLIAPNALAEMGICDFHLFAAMALHNAYRSNEFLKEQSKVDVLGLIDLRGDPFNDGDATRDNAEPRLAAAAQFESKALQVIWDINVTWANATHHALMAMELLGTAELLSRLHQEETNSSSRIETEISKRAQRAALKRHAGNHQLRAKAVEMYQARPYKSIKDASKQIFLQIQAYAQESGIAPLSTETGPDTVYRWLFRARRITSS